MGGMKENGPERDEFEYEMQEEPKPGWRMSAQGVAVLALALLLIGLGAAAFSARGLPIWPPQMVEAMAEPEETPAETPAPEPAPTPAEETVAPPDATPDTAEFERTAFVVDGVPLGVLASREAAESAEREAVAWFELQILGGGTLETTVENEIVFAPAADYPEAQDTTLDALLALLTGPDTPLTVRSTLTEELISHTEYESVTEEEKTLLAGTRIIVRYGVDGETHTITTRTFVNGAEQGKPETVTVTAREAVNALVREGVEKVDMEAEPGKREGERGRDAGALVFLHPTERGRIISNYGQREGVLHLGLDYDGEVGEDVLASAAGTVVSAIERGGYGLMVEVDHGDGFVTRYAHLDSIAVSIGDTVAAGDKLGTLGASGNCREPHLHFELRIDGIAYNPRYYLG